MEKGFPTAPPPGIRGNRRILWQGRRLYLQEGTRITPLDTISEVAALPGMERTVQWAVDLALRRREEGLPLEEARRAPREVLAEGGQAGKDLHAFLVAYAQGEAPPLPEGEEARARSFMAWWRARSPRLLAAEETVAHPEERFGGRFDLLLEIGGKVVLLEAKRGRSSLKAHLQAGGYALALEAWWGIRPDQGLVLELGPERVREVEVNLKKARAAFLAALTVYRFAQSIEEKEVKKCPAPT
ncbi:MAG: PD-(D/E)XK nuclease family protein [Thermus sp.]